MATRRAGRLGCVAGASVWLALAGQSPAFAATPPALTPITDDGVSVTIARNGAADDASGRVEGVELTIEVVDDELALLRGYRSMASVVDIDCHGERDRVRSIHVFERPRLTGASHPRPVTGEWVRPTPEAYLAKVIKQVCANQRPGRQPTPPARLASAPPAAAAQALSNEAPAPKVSTSTPPLPRPARVASTRPAAPRFEVSSARRPRGEQTQPRAQLGSNATRQGAQQVLDAASSDIRPPLAGEVELAQVHGRTVYRSIVVNFTSVGEAQGFCAGMTAKGHACIVRTGQASPPSGSLSGLRPWLR